MKLLLCSSGFTNEKIITTLENLVKKPRAKINFVIINEAIKGEPGDHRWFAEGLAEITANFGGKIEFVDLQAHDLDYIQTRIAMADVIFCFGGNTDYLANIFTETGFAKILPQILAEKVWVGSSAGSCVLCHKESDEIQASIFKEKRQADRFMDQVPIIFLPHLHGFFDFDKAEVLRASELSNLPVYALSDQAALLVEGERENLSFDLIGEDYLLAKAGQIEQQG